MNIKVALLTAIALLVGCKALNAADTSTANVVVRENLNEHNICQNDPHASALRDALDIFYRSALSYELQNTLKEMVISGHYKTHADAIHKILMDISKIKVRGRSNTESNVVSTASLISGGQSILVLEITYSSPQAASISRLRWVINGEDVTLSEVNSFIDGMTLDDLMNRDAPLIPKISFCLASVLMDAYQGVNYEKIISSNDIENWLGSSPIIGNGLAEKHENDLGQICKYSFSNRSGSMVAEFLGRCP